jgi:hypothetical protein
MNERLTVVFKLERETKNCLRYGAVGYEAEYSQLYIKKELMKPLPVEIEVVITPKAKLVVAR